MLRRGEVSGRVDLWEAAVEQSEPEDELTRGRMLWKQNVEWTAKSKCLARLLYTEGPECM